MYFPNEDMKVNKFKLVFIPSNSDYMSRIGMRTLPPGAYSGDDEVHRQQNKVEDIDFYMRYAEQKAREMQSKSDE